MKFHSFDPLSFISGTVITLIGLVFLLPRNWDDLTWFIGRIASWVWPVIFLIVGMAVLIPALLPRKTGSTETQEP